MNRIDKEKEIVHLMITLYCLKKHRHRNGLCRECSALLEYTYSKLNNCRFGDMKGSCKRCPIHCFKGDMQRKIKGVMRFSGPRIIVYRPFEFIKHILK